MNGILYNEKPQVLNPELARMIGLGDSIVLQQIHYWVGINEKTKHNFRDGYFWTYNTYAEWVEQFPFWSRNTIIRTIKRLESKGYLISSNYNPMPQDHTKWYRIDYDALPKVSSPSTHNEQVQVPKVGTPLPETNAEIIAENSLYGEFNNVSLTDNQYEKLLVKFGKPKALELIEHLSAAIKSKGYKYTDYYATILNWERRDQKGGNSGTNKSGSRKLVERNNYTRPEDL